MAIARQLNRPKIYQRHNTPKIYQRHKPKRFVSSWTSLTLNLGLPSCEVQLQSSDVDILGHLGTKCYLIVITFSETKHKGTSLIKVRRQSLHIECKSYVRSVLL